MNPISLKGAQALPLVEAASAPAPADAQLASKAKGAAEKFEAFFIADLLHQMRSTTRAMADEDSFYQNRINQDMLDMADTVVADAMSHQHAFGIADAILKQILPASAEFKSAGDPVASVQHGAAASVEKVRTE